MDIIKSFISNELHTDIVIKGTTEEPLFRASDIGEILEISNIRSSIRDFDDTEKVLIITETSNGNQQVTFLTEKGLYKILFKSRKPIAETFQNWVCEAAKEIRLHGIYNLQKELEKQKNEMQQLEENKNKEYEEKLQNQKILEREKILLKEYGSIGAIVYIIKVKSFENGQYIIKIGESRKGITNRYNEHKSSYEECLLLDCFSVQRSKDFEFFLHNHEQITREKVRDLPGHESEMELFLIGKNLSYSTLINIIQTNIKYYNDANTHHLELEIEQLKLMLEMKQTQNENPFIQELAKNVKQLSNKIEIFEKTNFELINKVNSLQTKTTTGFQEPLATLGPRLQKINPDSLALVQVYESVSEAMRENPDIKRPSLNKAIVENTVYRGFRWLFVDRELDPSIIHHISPTKKTKIQNVGYIAKLNHQKTEILNVYLDRKTAAQLNGYESPSALDNPVKNYTITKGYYYRLYHECDERLQEDFENKYGKPLLYKDGVGQYDLENNLVQEFACKYDCIKSLSMSDKTLAKSLEKNIPYNGFYYKMIGQKLSCI